MLPLARYGETLPAGGDDDSEADPDLSVEYKDTQFTQALVLARSHLRRRPPLVAINGIPWQIDVLAPQGGLLGAIHVAPTTAFAMAPNCLEIMS